MMQIIKSRVVSLVVYPNIRSPEAPVHERAIEEIHLERRIVQVFDLSAVHSGSLDGAEMGRLP